MTFQNWPSFSVCEKNVRTQRLSGATPDESALGEAGRLVFLLEEHGPRPRTIYERAARAVLVSGKLSHSKKVLGG